MQVAGRADALAVRVNRVAAVLDWKSGVAAHGWLVLLPVHRTARCLAPVPRPDWHQIARERGSRKKRNLR